MRSYYYGYGKPHSKAETVFSSSAITPAVLLQDAHNYDLTYWQLSYHPIYLLVQANITLEKLLNVTRNKLNASTFPLLDNRYFIKDVVYSYLLRRVYVIYLLFTFLIKTLHKYLYK